MTTSRMPGDESARGEGFGATHRAGKHQLHAGRTRVEYPDTQNVDFREDLEEPDDGVSSIVKRLFPKELRPPACRLVAIPWMNVASPPFHL
jgi:hypothetical protein